MWGQPMSSPIRSVGVLICVLHPTQPFSIDHWTSQGENYYLVHWQVFGISLIGYDIVHPLTISSSTPDSTSVNPLSLPHAQLCPTDRPVFRRKFLVSNLKVLSLCTCNQCPKRLLDLTLGLQFVMCGSLSYPCNFYYVYIKPEGQCVGNKKKNNLSVK